MTRRQRAQFGFYQRKKHFDKLGFKAITEHSSFGSNIYKWKQGMEQVLKTKDELDVQLAEAIRVRPLERSKCYYFVFSHVAVNAQ